MATVARITNGATISGTRAWVPIHFDLTLEDDTGGAGFSIQASGASNESPAITPVISMTTHGSISETGDEITGLFIPTNTKVLKIHFEMQLYTFLSGAHTSLVFTITPSADEVPGTEDTVTILFGNDYNEDGVFNEFDPFKGSLRVYAEERLCGFISDSDVNIKSLREVDALMVGDQSGALSHFAKKNGYQVDLDLQQYIVDNIALQQGIAASNISYSDNIPLPGGGTGTGNILELIPEENFLDSFCLRLMGFGKKASAEDVMWWFPSMDVIASKDLTHSKNAATNIGMTLESNQNPQTKSFGRCVIGNLP